MERERRLGGDQNGTGRRTGMGTGTGRRAAMGTEMGTRRDLNLVVSRKGQKGPFLFPSCLIPFPFHSVPVLVPSPSGVRPRLDEDLTPDGNGTPNGNGTGRWTGMKTGTGTGRDGTPDGDGDGNGT